MRIPESRKFFLQESGIREILLVEYPEFQEPLAFAILVPMIKNRDLVNGILKWNAGSKAVLDFITWGRSRQMIACFLSLQMDFYLEQTACFIYFLQVIWLSVTAQGFVMGFFSRRGGQEKAHTKVN